MPEITRSTGIVPGFEYMGPLPGGGYRGITEELDAAVAQAAELLRVEYGRDVEIRFNSDRQSGGAWVIDDLPGGWAHKCLVGLKAESRADRGALTIDELLDLPRVEYDQLPRKLVICTYVTDRALQDPSRAMDGFEAHRYCHLDHPTLDSALAWLRENVREGAFNA